MIIIRNDLWLCVDCLLLAVSDERVQECEAGLNALGAHLVPNFDTETGEGHRDFSACGCDCCGSPLAGEMHRFAILGPKPKGRTYKYNGVRYVAKDRAAPEDFKDPVTCQTCYRTWEDGVSTGITPTPVGRCPFEHMHRRTT